MEKHSALSAHLAYLGNRHDRAYLIVRVHDADKTGIVSDSICDLLCRDRSERTDREQCDLEALFFQLFERMEHSVMLKGGGNNVLLTLARTYPCRRHKRLIVGFAAAGGKVYLARRCAETRSYTLARIEQRLSRPLSCRMQARRVCVDLGKIRHHSLQCDLARACGRRVICIYHHVSSPLRRTTSPFCGAPAEVRFIFFTERHKIFVRRLSRRINCDAFAIDILNIPSRYVLL